MFQKTSFTACWLVLWCCAASFDLQAQITIDGVTDRTTYTDSVSFRVQTNTGFTYEATLNGRPVPTGIFNLVSTMDYYDLAVRRTQISDSSVVNALVRFIVLSSQRGSPERGLIQWVPLPPIPSTAQEMAGARLLVMTPQDYPAGLEIPVIAQVEDEAGNARRVNGWVNANGFEGSTFRVLRGLGHGFLPVATPGTISYDAQLQSLQTNKQINIEASTTWTTVSGTLGTTTWPPNSRIHVTGNLTIPAGATLTIGAGSVLRLNPGVNITNTGRTVINGTTTQPVVFTSTNRVAPEQHAGAWGGWIMRGASAELIANAAIMTGSGAATGFNFSPGSSHKSDQPLLLLHSSATVRMTNCALITQAGQIGNGYFSSIVWDHCLIQRAVTCGEYEGCTNIINRSAVIEFPSVDGVYNATIADADYDGYYTIRGTNYFAHSLFGFAKDDAIDSGSGGPGTVVVTNCWVESALHEALAWSGEGRQTWTRDTVLMNSGQGIECGWSTGANSPLCYAERIFSTANSVGARYGDNYEGTSGLGLKTGFLTVTNSLILHNYRDVWGQVWDNTWNYRVASMDLRNNWLTAPNTNHPNNAIWDPAADAPKLVAFMSTPPDAPVGLGLALWSSPTLASLSNGIPVRLSSFTTNFVSVDFMVASAAGPLTNGTIVFAPGETVKKITAELSNPQSYDLLRITLSNPTAGELTGQSEAFIVNATSVPGGSNTTLIPMGAAWRYLDDGSNQGTAWRSNSFNDLTWSNGVAQLGYGDSPRDEATLIRSTRTNGTLIATTYFRKTIAVSNLSQFANLSVRLLRDDAGVVYLNGREILRSPNMPANFAYDTFTGGTAPPDNTIDTTNITGGASLLIEGNNLIAVEIHQQSDTSSDVSFDLELIAQPMAPPARLFVIRFGGELVFYWSEPGYLLEQAGEVTGPWNPTPGGASSPISVEPSSAKQFYRLRKP